MTQLKLQPDGKALVVSSSFVTNTSQIMRLLGDDGPPRTVRFSAWIAEGRPPLSFQWFRDETNAITGATNVTLDLSSPTLADAGRYRLVVSNTLGTATSDNASLTLTDGPVLLSAGSPDGWSVGLRFNAALQTPSAEAASNYLVSSGGPVTNATLRPDRRTVVLRLAGAVSSPFVVSASNLIDAASALIVGGSATGRVEGLTPVELGAPARTNTGTFCFAPGEVEIMAGGADFWGNNDVGHFACATHTGDFDVRVKVPGLTPTTPHSKAGLMARSSLAVTSACVQLISFPPPPGRSTIEGSARLTAGGVQTGFAPNVPVLFPDVWLRLQRRGNLFSAFNSSNGLFWTLQGTNTVALSNSVFLGLAASPFDADPFRVTATFQNYSHYAGSFDELDIAGAAWPIGPRWESPTGWRPEFAVTHDGIDALRSGVIGHQGSSILRGQFNGPGELTFWWKVSSEEGHDRLNFSTNGALVSSISGEVDWQSFAVILPSGVHLLEWTYMKDAGGTAGADAAWLDQFTYTPAPAPPVILSEPVDQLVGPGSNAIFRVEAVSAAPAMVTYQWFFEGTAPVGTNGPVFSVTNAGLSAQGGYSVVVSSPFGAVISRTARLDLLIPPTIVAQPQSQIVVEGELAIITVTVTNAATLPIGYRLRKTVGGNITNRVVFARECAFTFTDVGTNAAGTYFIVITNAATTGVGIISGNAVLTVLRAASPVAQTVGVTNIAGTSATLRGTVNPQGASATAWFEYGLTPAYGSATPAQTVGNGSNAVPFSADLAGLLPALTYHFRVVATNRGGLSVGADLSFQTTGAGAPVLGELLYPPGGPFRFRFAGTPGAAYVVLGSTNLADWSPLGAPSEPQPGAFEFLDPDSATRTQRFYRVGSP
jgi:regulation of enolase protein 1 (concanavalin A-like superfamily)